MRTGDLPDNSHSDFLRDEKCFRATRRLVFFLMLGLRSAVSEISGNTIFEHGGCFFFMLGLKSAVFEISGNTIFEHGGCFSRKHCEGFFRKIP